MDQDNSSSDNSESASNHESDEESDYPALPKRLANAEIRAGKECEAPTIIHATKALQDLKTLLKPPRKTGRGYVDPDINPFIRVRMEGMQAMLNFFITKQSTTFDAWGKSSLQAAIGLGHGTDCARQLRKLCRQFIDFRDLFPINPFGHWNKSMLSNEDLTNEINLYLMELDKNISASKLVEFLGRPDVRSRHEIEKTISERTAQRYLKSLGYHWSTPKKGQYADGHEREDMVYYREKIFLPEWMKIAQRMESWSKENLPEFGPRMPGAEVVVRFHDETVFYAHDRRKKGWYHKDESAKPYVKGEGASLMVADFVSAKFGWLRSHNGTKTARRVIKPGKNKDVYYSSEDICDQAEEAMAILQEFYPQYEHVFIYDNATTHLKRPADALSARRMPKNIPKAGTNWGVETTKRNPITGKIEYNSDGSPAKIKIRMSDARFADGTPQPLYFPEGHQHAGLFKGTAVILEERGFESMNKVRAECKNFKCLPDATSCCCCRILYNQPDFIDVLKQPANPKGVEYYSCQNFIVNLTLSSSVGVMLNEFIVLIPIHHKRTYFNKMLCKPLKVFHLKLCGGLPTDPITLWMLISVDSMGDRQPGLQGNTVVIEYYLTTSWKN